MEINETYTLDPIEAVDEALWDAYYRAFPYALFPESITGEGDTLWVDGGFDSRECKYLKGFAYYSIYDYYPKNKYQDVSDKVDRIRRLIWAFKDGENSEVVAKIVTDAILSELYEHYGDWTEYNTVFTIIPGSTKERTSERYEAFCEAASDILGVINGYNAITVAFDIEPQKGKMHVDKTGHLRYHSDLIRGKHVILFDDVKTTGASFIQNAEKLTAYGAQQVIGVFLGETVDSFEAEEVFPRLLKPSFPLTARHYAEIDDEPDDLLF